METYYNPEDLANLALWRGGPPAGGEILLTTTVLCLRRAP